MDRRAHDERIRLGTAIMQMPARSPATTAATVATLDLLSGGRVLLGLGTCGPQVAEGWHGQAWGKPLTRTREYVEIVRTILRREQPLEHHGEHYDIPYSGPDATGLGKPLRIIIHPPSADVPIYLAAIGPKNVALAAEIADGWLPIFFSPEHFAETHAPMLEEGFARRGGSRDGWDLAAHVPVVLADDVEAARDFLKPLLALYVGGMGAKGRTSTPASPSATGTATPPRRSRISTSPARRTRRSPPFRTRSSTTSPWWATGPGSPTAWRPSARAA